MVLCSCEDDYDDSKGRLIYTWDEQGPIVAAEYNAMDSLIVLHSTADIETKMKTSMLDSEAYKNIANVNFAKYDLIVCWTNNHFHDFIAVEQSDNQMIVSVRRANIIETAIPFIDYSAVRISKTNIPDDNIQYVYERLN